MATKQVSSIVQIQRLLRKSSDPQLRQIAEFYPEGHKFFLKTLKVLETAQKVKLPKGVEIKAIDFSTTSQDPKVRGMMLASKWISAAVMASAQKTLLQAKAHIAAADDVRAVRRSAKK